MRMLSTLIIKLYRIIYYITGLKLPSFILALLYITVLHVITIVGLVALVQDIMPIGNSIRFVLPPYLYGLIVLMLGINIYVTPRFSTIITDINRNSSYLLLIVYTLLAGLLLGFEILTLY